MAPQNTTSNPNTAFPTPPPEVAEWLAMYLQNGSLHLAAQTPPPPTTAVPNVSPPPMEGRSFTRPGRGQGGALTEKQRVSKQITASSTKRKSLVDPDLEIQSPSTLDPIGKGLGKKPAKRVKMTTVTAKVRNSTKFFTNY